LCVNMLGQCSRLLSSRIPPSSLASYFRTLLPSNGCGHFLQAFHLSTDVTRLSLTEALPTRASRDMSSEFEDESTVKMTTLKNGLRVVSQNKFGMHCTVGVMVSAGPRFEINHVNGTSHFIEKLGFHSTDAYKDRDAVQAELENCSAIFDCQIARDFVVYAISGIGKHLKTLVHVLSETTLRPQITDKEVEMAGKAVGFELATLEMSPPVEPILNELLHSAAYGGINTLGLARYCPKENIESITRKGIMEFMASLYRPERSVLVGVGVDHEEFVRFAEQSFIPWETSYGREVSGSALIYPDQSTPMYFGGELSVHRDLAQYHAPMPEYAHCAIGMEACGSKDAQFVTACLLNSLLGGGGSFSAGGPGKGMYSRLYLNVLNQYHWVNSAQAANHAYADTGLFAITGSCEPENLHHLVKVLISEIRHTVEAPITANELQRAKNQLESMLLMNLEMRPVAFEDLARQVLASGEWKPPEYWVSEINKVTSEDLQELMGRMLKSPPTMVGYGNMEKWPSYSEVTQALGAPLKPPKSFSDRFPTIFKRFV
uniref:Alpha-MPP n=1 Tax=Schistocephalus solidus TaxID=70667 RepID=A0A183T471_SCHSO